MRKKHFISLLCLTLFAFSVTIYSFLSQLCVKTYAFSSSSEIVMDVNSGRILPSKTIEGQDYSTYNTEKLFENTQWKIPTFDWVDKKALFSITIANSEYDHNMHVNNTRYASYCMNVFSVEELKTKALKNFSISYIKQCKEGETLRFYRNEVEKDVFTVQGINDGDEIVVQAKITFI